MDKEQPACHKDTTQTGMQDCRSCELWLGFYRDFAERRQVRSSVFVTGVSLPPLVLTVRLENLWIACRLNIWHGIRQDWTGDH